MNAADGLRPEGSWHKALTWRDGLVMMFPVATGIFVSSGFMVGALGAWGTLLVLLVMGAVAFLANFLFTEMALMYPDEPGGLATYVRGGLEKHFLPGAVLGAFGYWMGYTLSIGFGALQCGTLIQMQWFAGQTWTVPFVGGVQLTLAHFIALAIVLLVWVLTLTGVRVAVRVSTWVGIAFMVIVAVILVGPLVTGHASLEGLTLRLPGWKATAVWMYIAGWTMFVSELVAVFAPEYRDPRKDTPKALLSSGAFVMVTFGLTPLMAAALLGEKAVGEHPLSYGPLAAAAVFGGGSQIFTALGVAAIPVAALVFMNDTARAAAAMARHGVSIRQLGRLNRFGAPAWGATLAAAVNIFVLLFVANPLGIILASNLGYILAHVLAVWSFLILRKTEPDLARPLRIRPYWIPIAFLVAIFDTFILVMGVVNPGLAGYGGLKETLIAFAILGIGLAFWVVRVTVQDRGRLTLRRAAAAAPRSDTRPQEERPDRRRERR